MSARNRRRGRLPSYGTPSGLVRGDDAVTDWQSIREWVLERDQHLCQICRHRGATDVDHIWPRRLGGEDHVDNLRAACGPCNKAKGARVDLGRATEAHLTLGIDTLNAQIETLQAERDDLRLRLLVRSLSDHRKLASDVANELAAINSQDSTLQLKAEAMGHVLAKLLRPEDPVGYVPGNEVLDDDVLALLAYAFLAKGNEL
jgi:5-methylcytosine-specific restriction protein A